MGNMGKCFAKKRENKVLTFQHKCVIYTDLYD